MDSKFSRECPGVGWCWVRYCLNGRWKIVPGFVDVVDEYFGSDRVVIDVSGRVFYSEETHDAVGHHTFYLFGSVGKPDIRAKNYNNLEVDIDFGPQIEFPG